MNLIKTENNFNHEIFGDLTTISNNSNEVFFIVKEVATILDFDNSNDLTKRLDLEDIVKVPYSEAVAILNRNDINSRGIQLLTESGLYSAVLSSKKPEAKQFKKWVTSEVLPAIRKSGAYIPPAMSQLDILASAISALQSQEARITNLEERVEHVALRLAEPEVITLLGVPNPSSRQKVEAIVAGYTKATMGNYRENWNILYSKLYLHYRIKVKNYKKSKKQSWLDVIEKKGHCDELLAVATKYFSI